MKKVLVLAANGQIARLVEHWILTETAFKDVDLALFLRHANRLSDLADNQRGKLVDGDLMDAKAVSAAMVGQGVIFVAVAWCQEPVDEECNCWDAG